MSNDIKAKKKASAEIIPEIEAVLSENKITYVSQGKYEVVINNSPLNKKQLKDLLNEVPYFNSLCKIYEMRNVITIRVMYS